MVHISKKLTSEVRNNVVEKTIAIIRQHYVFPEIGVKIVDFIQDKFHSGKYSDLDTASDFCSALNEDLHEASQDGHLVIFYSPEVAARLRETVSEEENTDEWFEEYHIDNYGLTKAEYMIGNVGYLDIRIFAPPSYAKDAAISMMNYISNCDALIIDVRYNGGGDPHLVQLIESYFFEKQQKLLLSFYQRNSDSHEQIYTIPDLPGKYLPTIPIYILTSKRTFSGAEDFTYTLKHHGRALVVGEQTGGGANTVDERVVDDDFVVNIPSGYPTHPETNSNWEGTGVIPDIVVPHDQALGVAHVHAIKTLIERTDNEETVRKLKYELERAKVIYTSIDVSEETLSKYVGTYGNYLVDLRNSTLKIFHKTNKRIQWKLIPLSNVLFAIENHENNVRFDVDESGKAVALVFLHWSRDRENPIRRINGWT